MQAVPPGWYPDPAQTGGTRWWDGHQWTPHAGPPPAGPPPGQAEPVADASADLATEERLARRSGPWLGLWLVLWVARQVFIEASARHSYQPQFVQPGQRVVVHLSGPFLLLGVVCFLAGIGAAIPFLQWQYQAATTARRLGYPARLSPGLGVGGWFIPIVNLWFPQQALSDCLPPGHPARGRFLGTWWLYVVGSLFVAAGAVFARSLGAAVVLSAIGLVLLGVTVVQGRTLVGIILDDHRAALAGR